MSDLEDLLLRKIRAAKLPEPTREFKFSSDRQWRFDFAFLDHMVAVEVEGGVHSGGRHTTGIGFVADCEKYNMAQLSGWVVLRFTDKHIKSPVAVPMIELALDEFNKGSKCT